MEWQRNAERFRVPILSWCRDVEQDAMRQAENLARHPGVFHHVALMPDCHPGYGMPIGGVIACPDSVIPNAVGVDIGCGMCAVETDIPIGDMDRESIRAVLDAVNQRIPVGEGHAHREAQSWEGFDRYWSKLADTPGWLDAKAWDLAERNLGTLGGGNHFIEMQRDEQDKLWLMVHSGSRNLGYRIAAHYHAAALGFVRRAGTDLPDADLAYLPADSRAARDYLRDMNFALEYAAENRARMMRVFADIVTRSPGRRAIREINIHHNYAAREQHFGKQVWIHRKGATAARKGLVGIIPGSMGTPSYIVEGRGAPESFMSCSHGAGRRMGRAAASRNLTKAACDRAMQGVVFDGWSTYRPRGRKRKGAGLPDLGEAPPAYKDIDEVIAAQHDLVETLTRLVPVGVVKG